MNPQSIRWTLRAAMAAAALLLAGCISGVPVSITNESTSRLTHVTVSGNGFSESVGTIAAGATETIRIRPRVATTVKIAFDLDDRHYSAATEEEIENDDVNVIVATLSEGKLLSIETRTR